MKRINFEKLNDLMNKKKNTEHNNNVEFGKDDKKNTIDVSSNYQDTDQIIDFAEKTLRKNYSRTTK